MCGPAGDGMNINGVVIDDTFAEAFPMKATRIIITAMTRLAGINQAAAKASTLAAIRREYSLYEIAIMTRAAPARSLGLQNRGHLGVGAVADITVYTDQPDKEQMFGQPDYVFKDGALIVRDGRIRQVVHGATQTLRPEFDRGIERSLRRYFADYQTVSMDNFKIDEGEIMEYGNGAVNVRPCG